jgi:diguanylate cyclase (GGDEF)-like protein
MSLELSSVLYETMNEKSLFSELNEEEFKIVASVFEPLFVKQGDLIFREGDAGKDMFILYSGAVNAFGTQSDGNQRLLFALKQRGQLFGEMSMVANEPRSMTISAAENSVVLLFRITDFYRILAQNPIIGFKILKAIIAVENQKLDQSSESYNDLIRWGETARRRAITDEMTGLYNRRFLEDSIKERFSNQSMNFRSISLLMIDLDKLHSVNALYGPQTGDLVITAAADAIRSCLRPIDIPTRLAGDEFAVLLPDTSRKSAVKIAARIRENIAKMQVKVPASHEANENVTISTHASIGIAIAPDHAGTTQEFVNAADSALKKAKDLGRNRAEVFDKNSSLDIDIQWAANL